MEYRTLEINVISGKDLNDVNLFTKMDVYVAVSIAGDPQGKQKTKVDRDGGKNPTWNFSVKFTIDETAARKNNVTVLFQLRCERALGDKDIGEVHVPVKELLETVDKPLQHVSYQVRTPSGKAKGVLNISYKFGEKFTPATAPAKPSGYEAAVTAYPASAVGPSSGYPPNTAMSYAPPEKAQYPPPEKAQYPPPNVYPPPQPVAEYGYPQQQPPPQTVAGYGYPQQQQPPPYGEYPPPPPPQPSYGYPPQPGYGYPPQPGYGYPPQQGYGYPPQQGQGYPPQQGYGYPPQQGQGYPPVQQPAAKKKNNFGGMGMGLGAGLLGGAIGGMLIGDMVSDGGFDDDGGF